MGSGAYRQANEHASVTNATWFVVIGAVLMFMALTAARIKRLPLSIAIVYLSTGILLGPTFADQFHFNLDCPGPRGHFRAMI